VIHERESSQNWFASLAQGDPWNRVSVRVPAGRGPFASWEEAAINALVDCAPHVARRASVVRANRTRTITGLDMPRGVPSPYLWSGTDQYKSGKYVRDGVYDFQRHRQSTRMRRFAAGDDGAGRTISFDGKMPPVASPSSSAPPLADRHAISPSVTNPSKGSIGAFHRFHRFHPLRHLQSKKEMTMWIVFDAVVFVAGYAISIYSWARIKLWVNGAKTEFANLEARVAALKAALKHVGKNQSLLPSFGDDRVGVLSRDRRRGDAGPRHTR
jgi:hypothetical protein